MFTDQISNPVRRSRNIFRASGIYGILILAPQLFREKAFVLPGLPMNHPEFFYGFFIVSLAFQFVFLMISSDPVRYRPMIFAGLAEKGGYAVACILLFVHHRMAPDFFILYSVDILFLCLFAYSYIIIKPGRG
jgi:hypothetical protein